MCAVGRDSAVRRGETPPSATAWTDRGTITLSDKPGGKRGTPRRHLHVGEKPEGHKGTGQTEPRHIRVSTMNLGIANIHSIAIALSTGGGKTGAQSADLGCKLH